MTLGVVLAAVGAADLVASGLAGHPVPYPARGVVTAAVVGIAAGLLTGLSAGAVALVGTVALIGTTAWIVLRDGDELAVVRAWIALAALAVTVTGGIAAGAFVGTGGVSGSIVGRALGALDVPAFTNRPPETVVLIGGTLLVMFATSNAVVRLVLIAAGPEVARSETRLRGGRLIGPLERLLIFGLAAADQMTAATIVVGAKSLLRFPEVSVLARGSLAEDSAILAGVDAVTEYFLIGSLTSWALALAPVVFTGFTN